MRFKYSIIAAASIIPLVSVFAPLFATPAASQYSEQNNPEGIWTGKFLQQDWTFELKNTDGDWSGKYKRSGGVSWQPLIDLAVSGRSVSFRIESKPQVSFSLKVDDASPNMSGTVAIDGMATVGFSAARVS